MTYANSKQEQEDLFQEIAIALWRSISKFEERSAESTWIYRIALNTAISSVRRAPAPFSDNPDFDAPGSPDSLEQEQEMDWIYRKLRSLNPVDRSLIVLYLEGTSYTEMAEIIGISESAVGVKISRVKTKLKTLIGNDKED